jgi:hypothetical protein
MRTCIAGDAGHGQTLIGERLLHSFEDQMLIQR